MDLATEITRLILSGEVKNRSELNAKVQSYNDTLKNHNTKELNQNEIDDVVNHVLMELDEHGGFGKIVDKFRECEDIVGLSVPLSILCCASILPKKLVYQRLKTYIDFHQLIKNGKLVCDVLLEEIFGVKELPESAILLLVSFHFIGKASSVANKN